MNPGRGGRNAKGSAETVNSLVSSACVVWSDGLGEACSQELVFPPREIANCNSEQIFRGIINNWEQYALGSSFDAFFEAASKLYHHISVSAVGDSASANVKGIAELFAYLRQLAAKHDIMLTGIFCPCYVHQFVRVLLLHLEHRDISAALYSVSRLHQQSTTRQQTKSALKQALAERFHFVPDSLPPVCPTTRPEFRRHLHEVLLCDWLPTEDACYELCCLFSTSGSLCWLHECFD